MMVKTIFSGFGGQGVLMMGYSFAHSAMSAGLQVSYLPSYGAEMRGGTANCTVAVSDDEIASPISSEPDFVVVMNTPSLYSFQNRVASRGAIFLNASIIEARPTRKDISVCAIPCGEIAEREGTPRSANIVMMGAFIKQTGVIAADVYLKSLEIIMGKKKKSLLESNRKAFNAGYEFVK